MTPRRPTHRGRPGPAVVWSVVVLALVLAGLGSRFASTAPDGLERVAAEHDLDEHGGGHALSGSPVAGYSLRGVDDAGVATGTAGMLGVVATLSIGSGVALLMRRARRPAQRSAPDTAVPDTAAPTQR